MDGIRDAEIHKLIGGAPCVDFVNTLNGHRDGPLGEPRHEYLNDYRDLVLWSRHAGILAQEDAETLLTQANQRPQEAQRALDEAIFLRETLYRIFKSLSASVPFRQDDLEKLNRTRVKVLTQSRIVAYPGGFRIDWRNDPPALDVMLTPLVLSAADLLTSDDLGKLRECDGDGCDWLFVDRSRNHLRRWCSMDHCGNRAKSRRQYERRKKIDHGLVEQ